MQNLQLQTTADGFAADSPCVDAGDSAASDRDGSRADMGFLRRAGGAVGLGCSEPSIHNLSASLFGTPKVRGIGLGGLGGPGRPRPHHR